MALNPEEVVNKRFSATKFRQGYDEEEVDEFLDEVVGELRRLTAENEELRGKLSVCEGRVAELSRAGSRAEPATAATERVPEPVVVQEPVVVLAKAPEPVAAPEPVPVPVAAAAASSGVESATGMLALAQRLHDEHVEAGKSKGAKLVSDAKEHADRLVREAEAKQRQTLGTLETQRQSLERTVEDLRSFEREYRSRLKAYLENQLSDLESSSAGAAGRSPESGSGSGQGQGTAAGQGTAQAGTSGLPAKSGYQGERSAPEEPSPGAPAPRFPFSS